MDNGDIAREQMMESTGSVERHEAAWFPNVTRMSPECHTGVPKCPFMSLDVSSSPRRGISRLCLKTLDAHDRPDSIRLRGVAPKSGSVEPSRGDNEAGGSNPAHRRRLRMASSASLPRLKGSTDPAFAVAPSGQSHSEPS